MVTNGSGRFPSDLPVLVAKILPIGRVLGPPFVIYGLLPASRLCFTVSELRGVAVGMAGVSNDIISMDIVHDAS
jgi:hypothetical protein